MLITEKILLNQKQFNDKTLFNFVDDNNNLIDSLNYGEFTAQVLQQAAKLKTQINSDDCALLVFDPSLDFIINFYACLFAGIVSVPVAEINQGQESQRIESINIIARDLKNCHIISNGYSYKSLNEQTQLLASEVKSVIEYQKIDDANIQIENLFENFSDTVGALDDLVCILYTSGSTATAKGVMIQHKDFMYNIDSLEQAWNYNSDSIGVSWIPQQHSFGIMLNILLPVANAATTILSATSSFVKYPENWLKNIAQYRASHSAAPTFGYLHASNNINPDKLSGIDLSCWQVAAVAAEPVKSYVYDAFFQKFGQFGLESEFFKPLYGMSECGPVSCITYKDAPFFKPNGDQSQNLSCASLGAPLPKTKIVCVDPINRTVCEDMQVGEIWISSPSITSGYWNKDEINQETFNQTLDGDDNRYYRSGDLGYLWNGELYITGRLKEVIIVRGKNYYASDLEWSASQSNAALQTEKSAVFSIDSEAGEKVVVVQEVSPSTASNIDELPSLINAIQKKIFHEYSLDLSQIILVNSGHIPRTDSGKIKRLACKLELDMLVSDAVYSYDCTDNATNNNNESIEPSLISTLKKQLHAIFSEHNLKGIDERDDISNFGVNSLQIVELANSIEKFFDVSFPATLFYKHTSFNAVHDYLEARI